ncbi:HET-domain-containing protein [Dissoconium aciculare CBS 342.82]|uniref:HET-domain-containing protein n=1 Tax=Dissoconium aciculare CBS 342.82 TaxID=1314786 RepID=A0A6J3MFA9_9PEZI|nr:HET-domain-containing protein [Dissoconium aciculare CBS 342.82]KAF1825557.1 HET-domain-containing protein [Dissoconium aciculare CBS 342.82]
MRLLNARSFKIEEFHGDAVPDYAILSHTWGREEISFADYHNPRYTSLSWNTRLKAGWRKIKHACEEASRRKFDYVWIDTCCIDKTSSAELSEAINSMAGWYRRAGVCIVYLVDYAQDEESGVVFDRFKRCRWFTRGWALQELIFPKFVEFYDSEWQHIGNKLDLMSQIREITKIDQRVLVDAAVLPSICVARKMSWAANRQTTRTEDTAYCLMGIFDVNMPLLYGEGRKAFQRLQEEILKKSNDFSILLWHPSLSSNDREEIITEYDHNRYTSILADSPACFSAGSSLEYALVDYYHAICGDPCP